jgi:UDP-hydrolysing UDP-N-acetyl-D-glucosamine 2-epimerase
MKKAIGIVTGTRAEYGLLSRLIQILQEDERFTTTVFACGAHLSPEYGYTLSEIENDNVNNIVPVEILMSSASKVGIAKSVGIATMSFADAFSRQPLDAVIVLGDRYEILAASQTAMFLSIPLIHIHGGEVTEGAFDDAIRHSISKMANVHFPATAEFANRLKQLGEQDSSVFTVGSPGVDNIVNGPRLSKAELESSLGFKCNNRLCLVTYHPVTKAKDSSENDISPLVQSIKDNPDYTYVITHPNADGGGEKIIDQWKSIGHFENVHVVPSLGFKRYLSIMEYVDCVVGNSSSGIIEAPSFNVMTINIGTRQNGRPRATSVLDIPMDITEINKAFSTVKKTIEKNSLKNVKNPYGDGGAATKMVEIMARIEFNDFLIKSFKDLDV